LGCAVAARAQVASRLPELPGLELPSSLWFWLSLALGVLLLLQLARQRFRAARRRHVILSRQALAYARERSAADLLSSLGFQIDAVQARTHYELRVDGEPLMIELRVDYLVSKHNLSYAADVKSGPQATRVQHAATRRQLLEYQLAYDVDGVLLVDMEREQILTLEFAPKRRG